MSPAATTAYTQPPADPSTQSPRRPPAPDASGRLAADISRLPLDGLHAKTRRLKRPPSQTKFHNWADSFRCRPLAIFKPTTEDEVRMVVELARREGRSLRCFGAGHSPSDLACSDEYMMSLDELHGLIKFDKGSRRIEVYGGTRITELNALAAAHGFAVPSLGSISEQSIAGAISTATHGAGVGFGNLSTTVRSLTLVLADGSLVTCSAIQDPELFSASVCGLGLTGVITRVEIELEAAFRLEEEVFAMSWKVFLNQFNEVMESAEHVRAYWFPQVGEVKVSRMRRTTKPETSKQPWSFNNLKEHFLHTCVNPFGLAVARYIPNVLPSHARFVYRHLHRPPAISSTSSGSPAKKSTSAPTALASSSGAEAVLVPSWTDPLISFPSLTSVASRVAPSVEVFNYDCGPPQYTNETCVPFDRAVGALEGLGAYLEAEAREPNGQRPHFPIEIRAVKGPDGIWMSPTYGSRGAYIGIMKYKPYGLAVPYKSLFGSFERILLAAGGRPHWAKAHTCSPRQLGSLYPRFGDFVRVVERVGGFRAFGNAYTRRHIEGLIGESVDVRRFKAKL